MTTDRREFLLEVAERTLGGSLPVTVSIREKATMVALSREMEEALLRLSAGGRLYAFFQTSAFFRPAAARYRRLAAAAEVHVIARREEVWPECERVYFHDLAEGDAFAQEWSLLVCHRLFSAALLSVEVTAGQTVPDAERRFRGALILYPRIVATVERAMRQRLRLAPVRPTAVDPEQQLVAAAGIMDALLTRLERAPAPPHGHACPSETLDYAVSPA